MRKVEAIIEIAEHPQTVLRAFTELEALRAWWGVSRALVDKQEGGQFSLVWNDSQGGLGYVFSGIIKTYQPSRVLEIENIAYFHPERAILGPMNLAIRLAGNEKKTALYLSQDGYGKGKDWDWYYQSVKDAWPQVLETLKSYLENKG